jgi:hypothetical protein
MSQMSQMITIVATPDHDDECTFVVRPAEPHERAPRGTVSQWVAFVGGGVLASGDDRAIFETREQALTFAAAEAERYLRECE